MKTLSFLISVALSSAAFSTSIETVVKVHSFACDTKVGIETSGVPITFRGKPYILTSQWGVLEESSNVCTEVFSRSRNEATPATLAYFDWASGTALLETKGTFDSVYDFDTGTPSVPSGNDRKIMGFPKGQGNLVSIRGRVTSAKSTRHHFAALPTVNELASEKIDSGMVGAPYYNNGLQGIVSSLWIEIIPGAKARINEWKTAGTEQARQFMALPIELLQERFKTLSESRITFQSMESKLGDRKDFYTKGIHWKLNCPVLTTGEPPNTIGPIGGPDGVGIGGSMKGTETCNMDFFPDGKHPLSTLTFVKENILKDITDFAAKNEKTNIPFLYYRTPGSSGTVTIGGIDRKPFLSFPHFFTELAVGTRLPVLVIPAAPSPESTIPYEQLRAESIKFRALLVETYPLIKDREKERAEFRKLYALTLLLDSIYWKEVKRSDMMGTALSNDDFAQGVEFQGEPLRKVLLKQHKIVDQRHFESGGIH